MKDTTEGKKMQDKIEKIGESIIQHGTYNNRIYLMKLNRGDIPRLINRLNELSEKEKYAKIFGKIFPDALPFFKADGYEIEAFIPNFYRNSEDCLFVSKFLNDQKNSHFENELNDFLSLLLPVKNQTQGYRFKHSLKYMLAQLGKEDAKQIASLFKEVFKSYPFPIFDAGYILRTMEKDKTQYFGVWHNSKLIGVSSAEIDVINKNAEMTDFAVLPAYRGQNLAFRLLLTMEQKMKIANIKTAYTIARLKELGMNKTFLKSGYKYSGTLLNNTNIGGQIESMNIFYKHL
jgi:lysine 2,3-aminomutase